MVFHYKASDVLAAEVWDVLRTPVTPWKSALAQQAIRESFERAQRRGGDQYETCCEDILSSAAGDAGLTPDARAELTAMLQRSELEAMTSLPIRLIRSTAEKLSTRLFLTVQKHRFGSRHGGRRWHGEGESAPVGQACGNSEDDAFPVNRTREKPLRPESLAHPGF